MSLSSCLPCGSSESASATAAAAALENDQYLTLTRVASGKVLVIPPDGKRQAFLGTTYGGFVFSPDGVNVQITKEPALTLPVHNAKVGGSYPLPASGVPFLMVGTAESDTPWKFLAAPTSGSYYLRSKDGAFELAEAEAIPGIDVVAAGTDYVNKGALLSPFTDGDGNVTLRKLMAEAGRVLVGRQALDGSRYYSFLDADEFLKHEQIQALKFFHTQRYEQLVPGAEEPTVEEDGIPLTIQDITDDYPVVYSVGGRRFLRRNNRTIASVPSQVTVNLTTNAAWQTMGSHCSMQNLQMNGKSFYVSAMVRLAATGGSDYGGIDFGLFIDGALVYLWNVRGAKDNTLTKVYQGVSLGEHDIEIRFRQNDKSPQTMAVVESNMELFTL